MPQIRRITLFKIPREQDQQTLLAMYKDMPTKAIKVTPSFPSHPTLPPSSPFQPPINPKYYQDSKPYILSAEAGVTQQDQRAQGYTIAATTLFASEEDFEFYDKECGAHAELRAFARSVNEGMCMVRIAIG
jgi:hypothetical protein